MNQKRFDVFYYIKGSPDLVLIYNVCMRKCVYEGSTAW